MTALRNKALPYVIALASSIAPAWAAADESSNPLGVYVGAAVGDANVRESPVAAGFAVDEHDTGWKLLAGLRPMTYLGAEVEYVDFGRPSFSGYFPAGYAYGNASDRAFSASALAYLPLPLPFFDVYAKAGVARLQESYALYPTYLACSGSTCGTVSSAIGVDHTGADFAYGGGLQFHFSALAVRAEYERIDDSYGSPEMVSLGLSWTF